MSIFYLLFFKRFLLWHFKFCPCFLGHCLLQRCLVSTGGGVAGALGRRAGALLLARCAASCSEVCKGQILICFFFLSWEDLTVIPVLRLLQKELSRPDC